MDRAYERVRDFQIAFGLPHNLGAPRMLEINRALLRANWMREEIEEFEQAQTLNHQADAMIDLMYFALGTLVEMGVPPQALFDIVHEANMQKLFEDGKPHYNAQNKVVKPPTWQDPYPSMQAWLDAYAGQFAQNLPETE